MNLVVSVQANKNKISPERKTKETKVHDLSAFSIQMR